MKRLFAITVFLFVVMPIGCPVFSSGFTRQNLPPPEVVVKTYTATSVPEDTNTPTTTVSSTSTQMLTDVPEDTPEPTPKRIKYRVQSGDTLGNIALNFEVGTYQLAVANGIKNPNLIYTGQWLIIPDPNEIPTIQVGEGKEIMVSLSQQKLYAYQDKALVNEFLVSTGLPDTPTVTGEFAVYLKYESTRMRGPGYDTPDVPWTMYFYKDYGLHGAYWHNNFGTPMSHGCVNLSVDDAHWLYDWAPIGTTVVVIP